jgi:hypothetical protein
MIQSRVALREGGGAVGVEREELGEAGEGELIEKGRAPGGAKVKTRRGVCLRV